MTCLISGFLRRVDGSSFFWDVTQSVIGSYRRFGTDSVPYSRVNHSSWIALRLKMGLTVCPKMYFNYQSALNNILEERGNQLHDLN
jgi:hypothetical protein